MVDINPLFHCVNITESSSYKGLSVIGKITQNPKLSIKSQDDLISQLMIELSFPTYAEHAIHLSQATGFSVTGSLFCLFRKVIPSYFNSTIRARVSELAERTFTLLNFGYKEGHDLKSKIAHQEWNDIGRVLTLQPDLGRKLLPVLTLFREKKELTKSFEKSSSFEQLTDLEKQDPAHSLSLSELESEQKIEDVKPTQQSPELTIEQLSDNIQDILSLRCADHLNILLKDDLHRYLISYRSKNNNPDKELIQVGYRSLFWKAIKHAISQNISPIEAQTLRDNFVSLSSFTILDSDLILDFMIGVSGCLRHAYPHDSHEDRLHKMQQLRTWAETTGLQSTHVNFFDKIDSWFRHYYSTTPIRDLYEYRTYASSRTRSFINYTTPQCDYILADDEAQALLPNGPFYLSEHHHVPKSLTIKGRATDNVQITFIPDTCLWIAYKKPQLMSKIWAEQWLRESEPHPSTLEGLDILAAKLSEGLDHNLMPNPTLFAQMEWGFDHGQWVSLKPIFWKSLHILVLEELLIELATYKAPAEIKAEEDQLEAERKDEIEKRPNTACFKDYKERFKVLHKEQIHLELLHHGETNSKADFKARQAVRAQEQTYKYRLCDVGAREVIFVRSTDKNFKADHYESLINKLNFNDRPAYKKQVKRLANLIKNQGNSDTDELEETSLYRIYKNWYYANTNMIDDYYQVFEQKKYRDNLHRDSTMQKAKARAYQAVINRNDLWLNDDHLQDLARKIIAEDADLQAQPAVVRHPLCDK